MADRQLRHPRDQGGDWFVDTTCFDCDVARQLAPGLIAEDADGKSYFARPPSTDEERLAAWRALLACPTGSIGAPAGLQAPRDAFPVTVAPGVQLAGFHARSSFGAHAYFVESKHGNLLVDGPRYVPRLVEAFDAAGGIAHILLTHRDDVADARHYAERFGAKTWIHQGDAKAAPWADGVFTDRVRIQPDVEAIPFPGHTKGSSLFLWQGAHAFTGDSLAWSRERNDVTAFRDATWYSWTELTRSVEKLAGEAAFEWMLPGHGSIGHDTPQGMQARLASLATWMRSTRPAAGW